MKAAPARVSPGGFAVSMRVKAWRKPTIRSRSASMRFSRACRVSLMASGAG